MKDYLRPLGAPLIAMTLSLLGFLATVPVAWSHTGTTLDLCALRKVLQEVAKADEGPRTVPGKRMARVRSEGVDARAPREEMVGEARRASPLEDPADHTRIFSLERSAPLTRPAADIELELPEGTRTVHMPEFPYHAPDPSMSPTDYVESRLNGRTFTIDGEAVRFRVGEKQLGDGGFSLVYELERIPPTPGIEYVVKIDNRRWDPSSQAAVHQRKLTLRGPLEDSANAYLARHGLSSTVRVEFLPGMVQELESEGITIMRRITEDSVANERGRLTVPSRYRPGVGMFGRWVNEANQALGRTIESARTGVTHMWNQAHMSKKNVERMRPSRRAQSQITREDDGTEVAVLDTPLDLIHPRTGAPGRFNLGSRMETYVDAGGVERERLVIEVYDF